MPCRALLTRQSRHVDETRRFAKRDVERRGSVRSHAGLVLARRSPRRDLLEGARRIRYEEFVSRAGTPLSARPVARALARRRARRDAVITKCTIARRNAHWSRDGPGPGQRRRSIADDRAAARLRGEQITRPHSRRIFGALLRTLRARGSRCQTRESSVPLGDPRRRSRISTVVHGSAIHGSLDPRILACLFPLCGSRMNLFTILSRLFEKKKAKKLIVEEIKSRRFLSFLVKYVYILSH